MKRIRYRGRNRGSDRRSNMSEAVQTLARELEEERDK